MKKIIALILVIVMAAVLFTGCARKGSASVAQIAAEEGAELQEITGSCEIEKVDENTLRVHCTTNLIPTTKIAVTLDSYKGENIDMEKMAIETESFTVDFEIEDGWEYPVTATIVSTYSDHGRQLQAVKTLYGNSFRNMTGEHVLWNSKGNFVAISSEPFEG
ncbi:MAG: hypothetical protein IKK29_07920 [Christensenellaceae bacterium]|nr:hypothetical protein [Christensenellaceae bacterium]